MIWVRNQILGVRKTKVKFSDLNKWEDGVTTDEMWETD